MLLSATPLAFTLLVCLQAVSAAPISNAVQRDMLEKREAGPSRSEPSTVFAYDDYVPPAEKRSALASPKTIKREAAAEALQAEPDVLEYHQYGAPPTRPTEPTPPPKIVKKDGPIRGFGTYIKPACDEGGTCYVTYGGKNGPEPTFQPAKTIEPEHDPEEPEEPEEPEDE